MASADTIITPSGTYIVSSWGSVTVISAAPGLPAVTVPAAQLPAGSTHTVITPQGTTMWSRVGSTVLAVPVAKGTRP